MRYLSILTFLFSIAVINPAACGCPYRIRLIRHQPTHPRRLQQNSYGKRNGFYRKRDCTDGTGQQLTVIYVGDASDTFGVKSTGAFTNAPKLFPILNDSGVYSINLYVRNAV